MDKPFLPASVLMPKKPHTLSRSTFDVIATTRGAAHSPLATRTNFGIPFQNWFCSRMPSLHRAPGDAAHKRRLAMTDVFVGKVSELQAGHRRIVKTPRGEIGVFVENNTYHAFANLCPHQGGPACEGLVMNRVVDIIAADRTYQGQTFSEERHFSCPWHGYEFDLTTGECAADRRLKVKKFDVVTKGEDVFVQV